MKKGKKTTKKSVSKTPTRKTAPTNSNKTGVTPLGDRVLIKPASLEEMEGATTSFGIIIPDTAKEKPEQGTIVAVGTGKRTDDGKIVPLNVKVGDKVMFSKYGFDEVKVGGEQYYIVSEQNISRSLKTK
jgi:chaperonin GroES